MPELALASLSAFWLGVLTSISPCPLATNIAAMTYVGRRMDSPRRVLAGGLAYTVGRAVAYGILGTLLVASLLNAPVLSHVLQKYLNQALGPLLILIGMFLLELLSLPGSGSAWMARLQVRMAGHGIGGALVLGVLFALSFCPISAVLFFGSLIPLAVANGSGVVLPMIYGLGTGVPVLVLAVIIALGSTSLGATFRRMTSFETWARRATGVVFVLVGIYLSLVYVFGVMS